MRCTTTHAHTHTTPSKMRLALHSLRNKLKNARRLLPRGVCEPADIALAFPFLRLAEPCAPKTSCARFTTERTVSAQQTIVCSRCMRARGPQLGCLPANSTRSSARSCAQLWMRTAAPRFRTLCAFDAAAMQTRIQTQMQKQAHVQAC